MTDATRRFAETPYNGDGSYNHFYDVPVSSTRDFPVIPSEVEESLTVSRRRRKNGMVRDSSTTLGMTQGATEPKRFYDVPGSNTRDFNLPLPCAGLLGGICEWSIR